MSVDLERPRVVVTAAMSVDGRLTLRRDRLLLDEDTSRVWRGLQPASADTLVAARTSQIGELYGPQAVLSGSGTFTTASVSPFARVETEAPGEELYTDFLPEEVVDRPGRERWLAVADSRGRVRWSIKSQGETDLLVVAAEETPAAYLSFLRSERIPYLVAGRERVDLTEALRRMRKRLGVTCVIADGGGDLNGSLLRSGLVDELQLLVFPAAIGGRATPSLFDGRELAEGQSPTRLRLLAARVEDDGMLWLRYEALREG